MMLTAIGFSSYPAVSERDRVFLNAFYERWGIKPQTDSIHIDPQHQIDFLQKIQGAVFSSLVGNNYPIPPDSVGSVEYYYKKGQGACYDRAILMEKVFSEAGFKTRHVYVYFRRDSSTTSSFDIFKKRVFFHAVLEAQTKKGWMVLDTSRPWIGVNEQGAILNMTQTREKLKQLNAGSVAGQYGLLSSLGGIPGNWKFVYGLYSRNGRFLEPGKLDRLLSSIGILFHPPDYNLAMLMHNLF